MGGRIPPLECEGRQQGGTSSAVGRGNRPAFPRSRNPRTAEPAAWARFGPSRARTVAPRSSRHELARDPAFVEASTAKRKRSPAESRTSSRSSTDRRPTHLLMERRWRNRVGDAHRRFQARRGAGARSGNVPALQFAHGKASSPRLKPENILIDSKGRGIADFGSQRSGRHAPTSRLQRSMAPSSAARTTWHPSKSRRPATSTAGAFTARGRADMLTGGLRMALRPAVGKGGDGARIAISS